MYNVHIDKKLPRLKSNLISLSVQFLGERGVGNGNTGQGIAQAQRCVGLQHNLFKLTYNTVNSKYI